MRFLILLSILILPLLSCTKAENVSAQKKQAVQEKYQEGVHYTVVKGRPKPRKSEKIEVMEIFWYGCKHCVVFEFKLTPWVKALPSDVSFVRSPAMWAQAKGVKEAMWTHAKVYYTAQALGVLDKVHLMFFQTIHKHKMRLVKHEDIERLINKIGLNGKAFIETLNSPLIELQVKQAEERLKTYKITGTPEIVVGGYYHVTTQSAGGQKGMLDVVGFLLTKTRAER